MSVFHVPSVCANTNARGVDALGRLCEHVDTFCTRHLVGEDFERVERELHERFVEAEREVLVTVTVMQRSCVHDDTHSRSSGRPLVGRESRWSLVSSPGTPSCEETH